MEQFAGVRRALMAAALLFVPAAGFAGAITSSFDSDTEGWTLDGDGTGPTWVSTGGVSGGYLKSVDGGAGSIWHFLAPEAFLGDRSRAYGQVLSFSLKQSASTSQIASNDDVILTGAGTSLHYDAAANPGTDWTRYTVTLSETGGWHKGSPTGAAPTEAEFRAVLSSLTALSIRGEFSSVIDTGGLDDVQMGLSAPTPLTLPIESNFDTSDEGWRVMGDVQNGSSTPTWLATDGNPGGNLRAVDNATGDWWFWLAPAKFLGDMSAAYGGTLSFDLKQSPTDAQVENTDVRLIGAAGSIDFQLPRHPAATWTHFDARLAAGAGWTLAGSTTAASEAQIRAVLADLLVLRIRGEYRTGPDTGWLDNVRIGATVLYGDVNADQAVDTLDVTAALRAAGGLTADGSLLRGDVAPKPSGAPMGFGDGRLDAADAARILRRIAGLETAWP